MNIRWNFGYIVSKNFLVLLRYSKFFFFYVYLFDVVFKYPKVFETFLFFERSYVFDLLILFLLSCVISWFSLSAKCIFLCQIPFLCPDRLFSLSVLRVPILFHFWQAAWCRPYSLDDWFFFLRFIKFVSACVFHTYVIEWHHRHHKY